MPCGKDTARKLHTTHSRCVRDMSFQRSCAISGTRRTDGIGSVSREDTEGNNRQLNFRSRATACMLRHQRLTVKNACQGGSSWKWANVAEDSGIWFTAPPPDFQLIARQGFIAHKLHLRTSRWTVVCAAKRPNTTRSIRYYVHSHK